MSYLIALFSHGLATLSVGLPVSPFVMLEKRTKTMRDNIVTPGFLISCVNASAHPVI